MKNTYEHDRAMMEAKQNQAEDEYFKARPQIDCMDRRRVFEAGFKRGWRKPNIWIRVDSCILPAIGVEVLILVRGKRYFAELWIDGSNTGFPFWVTKNNIVFSFDVPSHWRDASDVGVPT